MKKILVILLFIISAMHIVLAQSPYWMRSAGGTAVDEGMKISIDANNNTYTTGYFGGTCTFATGVTLTANGATDIFVSKVNDQGILQWVVKAGGMGPDRGLSIKADQQGNSYVTGIYFGTATFGTTTINSVGGSQDVFIAKYTTAGVLQWVVSAGGTEGELGNGITVDNSGNVFVTGQFSGTAQFGSISLTSVINPSTLLPSIDVFITKLDTSGNFLWAKKGSADYTDRGLDIAADSSGNVYVTGQFSDTITFDSTHNNNMYNAIFLIKYNSSGTEQWFRVIGGSAMNIAYGIAVDANSNIYLTGDFLGTLIFFGYPNVQLTNTYQNNIFVAKYDSAGNFLWSQADGSSSDVSSRDIALDDSSNAYIVGNFRCTFSEYTDVFGRGTFNSVGFKDIFVTKYNCNGQRQWMRQGGGQREDFGAGITVNTSKQTIITGSFNEKIFFPSDFNFTYPNSIYFPYSLYPAYTGTYCSDVYYGNYCCIMSYGNSDILIAKAIDPVRQPYDYYTRSPGNCTRPFVSGCINFSSGYDNYCDGNSVEACNYTYLNGATNTSGYSPGSNSPGPYFTWNWSNGSTYNYVNVNSSGNYSVTITSLDGCYTSSDTIYATIHPLPAIPLISDNYVVNTNALYPQPIHLCYPENVTLTGTTTAPYYYWTDGSSLIDSSLSITVDETGYYYFVVVDGFGCENYNAVYVIVDNALTPLNLGIMLCNDTNHNDSIEICSGQGFTILLYDTVTNPAGNLICINYANTIWAITPAIPYSEYCDTWINCYPTLSGYYQIDAQMIRLSYCDTDTFILSKTIYVTVYPSPVVNITISGNTLICPGDTTVLTASGASSYNWSGPWGGIISNPDSASISVNMTGNYYVSTSFVDSNDCPGGGSASINVYTITLSPVVTMIPSSGIICPNDSVLLHCSDTGNFQWYSFAGPFGTNSSSVYVSTPGFYYCVLSDTLCLLPFSSNSVEVLNYATPYLIVTPTAVLCPGGSLMITAVTSQGSTIQWQPPFSGSSLTQIVTSPGTYTCNITLCGITINASTTITMHSPVVAEITPAGPLEICATDSIMLTANSGMYTYEWSVPGSYNQYVFVSQAGTYTLTTTTADASLCTATDNFILSLYPEIPAPIVADTSICAGNSITLQVISSGSVDWFSYPFGGTSFASGSSYTTPVLTTNTIYYVQNTDTLCHSERIPLTVTVNPLPTAEAGNNQTVCAGTIVTLTATGGTSYLWNNGVTQGISFVPTATTTYTVTVSDMSGCTGTDAATVTVNPVPTFTYTTDSVLCYSDSSGAINILVSGGTTPYTYAWTPNVSTGPIANNIPAGTYQIAISDINGCDTATTITVGESPQLTLNTSGNITICIGQSTTISATATGGVGSYTFTWDNGLGTGSSFSVNPTTTTIYTVSATDGNACTVTNSLTVMVPLPISVNVISNPVSMCYGDTVVLTATPNGGNGNYTYTWGQGIGISTQSITVMPVTTTMYPVTVTDNCGSPQGVDSVEVIVYLLPAVQFTSDTISGCEPLAVTFADSSAPAISTWLWNFGDISSGSNNYSTQQNPTHVYMNAGVYGITLTVTTTNGCTGSYTHQNMIIVLPSPDASFSMYPNVGSSTLNPTITFIDLSTNASTWSWNFGEISSSNNTSNDQNPQHSYESAGIFTVMLVVENPYGCVDSTSNEIWIKQDFAIFFPNAFSPNGDNENNVFYVRGHGIKNLHLIIYDRWGEKVFETTSQKNGWDGTFHGKKLDPGVFVYYLEALFYDESKVVKKGNITLVK